MTKVRRFFTLTVSFLTIYAFSQEACDTPVAPAKLRSFENVLYKSTLGMDVYLPEKKSEALPLAFVIHGGAWIHGSRQDYRPLAKQLTAMGYVAVTVDYRLANSAAGKFPAPVEDLRCALKTLKKNAAKYSIDTNRVVAIGFSAGAHLAAELALTADSHGFSDLLCPAQEETTHVQGVVGYYGPYDLRDLSGLNFKQKFILTNFLGGLPSLNPKKAELASPAAQINNEAIPFYLVHAEDDETVPVRSSREFSQALLKSNNSIEYVETKSGKHALELFDKRDFAREATCGAIKYLQEFVAAH